MTGPGAADELLLLPTLGYQEGRLLMDEHARALGLPSLRTITQAYRVHGPLDVRALRGAAAALVYRHEALRVTFPNAVHQLLHGPVQAADVVAEVDLSSDADPEAAALRAVRAEATLPFARDHWPRLRISVLSLGRQDHVVVLVFDHLTVDAWARGLLLAELSALYPDLAAGADPAPQPPPYSYRDYVLDQKGSAAGERRRALIEHWSRKLEGVGAIPRLNAPPAARGGPVGGGHTARVLPDHLATSLRQVAASERATLFMILLTALKLALVQHTGAADQSVAVNVYNRESADTEELVAPLAELLVVRTGLAGAPGFREALARVKTEVLEAQEHAELSYADLVKALNPAEYARPEQPVGVVLNMLYGELFGGGLELAGARCAPYPIFDEEFRPRSELMVVGDAGGDRIEIGAYYQTDRLRPRFVEDLLDTVARILEDACVPAAASR